MGVGRRGESTAERCRSFLVKIEVLPALGANWSRDFL
jgi:hypothetical protein